MIQFNRYRLPDETPDFHVKFIALVNAIIHEMDGIYSMHKSMDLLRALAQSYPLNERIPAVAARLFFWGKCAWADIQPMLPRELPSTFFYKQEIVGCVGFERAAREWGIDEDQWKLYQGFDTEVFGNGIGTNAVCYQPRSSGFFSVIENIIAAAAIAQMDGYEFFVDLSGNWWNFEEPFEELFADTFNFSKTGQLPKMQFEHFRRQWLQPTDEMALRLANIKCNWYTHVYAELSNAMPSFESIDSAGVMFVRGGDKLQTETILPPMTLIQRELWSMARRCDSRIVLSDDKNVGARVAALDPYVIDRSHQVDGGYHHQPGRKVSCSNIIGNYLAMVEAKENMSCPSANIVNAAQWSRCEIENYSLSNPVYRYLLI